MVGHVWMSGCIVLGLNHRPLLPQHDGFTQVQAFTQGNVDYTLCEIAC